MSVHRLDSLFSAQERVARSARPRGPEARPVDPQAGAGLSAKGCADVVAARASCV